MNNYNRLKELEKSGEYVFHGSINRIDSLEPRQAHHKGQPDGNPAVCAADTVDVAIFMALYRGSQFLIDPPTRSATDNGHYYATRNVIDKAKTVTGYVHVLQKNGFRKFRGEMRSTQEVTPVQVIEVRCEDFPCLVEEITIDTEQA